MPSPLDRLLNLQDVEQAARRVLPRAVADFYAGGAEDELALARNRQAFEAATLRPRVLSGVREPDLSVTVFGQQWGLPIVVAPMGAVGFGRHDGDLALARAAASCGIPYAMSAMATTSLEQVAQSCGSAAPRWFQLYPMADAALNHFLMERAAAAGYDTLVVTVDVPVGGKRERDSRNHFTQPFLFTRRNVLDFARRPRWALRMLTRGVPGFGNLPSSTSLSIRAAKAPAASVGSGFDAGFDWHALQEVRRRWNGPLVLKGVLHPEDARLAREHGCDAVVVSNHGGRQLDSAPAALDALKEVYDAVGATMPIFVDGGVRRGSDIVKARLLGASAVLVGRPLLYGACVAGEAGVHRVIEILRDELRRTLILAGLSSSSSATPR